ncbi:MAG: redoxin domain-containing protein [Gammaproteobacteria bacterium]|nr:redoxin domain-containing protein [Gammaproteobacteria bacterium]
MKCGADKCGSGAMAMHKSKKQVQSFVTHKRQMVTLPEVVQIRADGKKVRFADDINDGRPVVLNFIFTTCTAICPISSSTFMQLQKQLGKDENKVHLVSVSIDPEQDTPRVLREYARKYHARPGWDFYTGTADNSVAIQEAFNVYRGDKMSHDPVTFVRTAPGKTWLRIDGFTTANALLQDYHKQLAANN